MARMRARQSPTAGCVRRIPGDLRAPRRIVDARRAARPDSPRNACSFSHRQAAQRMPSRISVALRSLGADARPRTAACALRVVVYRRCGGSSPGRGPRLPSASRSTAPKPPAAMVEATGRAAGAAEFPLRAPAPGARQRPASAGSPQWKHACVHFDAEVRTCLVERLAHAAPRPVIGAASSSRPRPRQPRPCRRLHLVHRLLALLAYRLDALVEVGRCASACAISRALASHLPISAFHWSSWAFIFSTYSSRLLHTASGWSRRRGAAGCIPGPAIAPSGFDQIKPSRGSPGKENAIQQAALQVRAARNLRGLAS